MRVMFSLDNKAMLLAIDVGNTNTVFALVKEGECVKEWRVITDGRRTSDEYAILFMQFLALSDLCKTLIEDVAVSCVVPQSLFQLKRFIVDYFEISPLIVGNRELNIGVEIDVNRPSEVGDDRLINALAVYRYYKKDAIIIDFGTATNFDVVTCDGKYLGGVISPGINLSMDALHKAAAKLPKIGIEPVSDVIGKNTESAMKSGIYFGYLGMIEGLISRLKNELGAQDVITIATGGLAKLFAQGSDAIDYLEPELTIKGLDAFYELNKEHRTG